MNDLKVPASADVRSTGLSGEERAHLDEEIRMPIREWLRRSSATTEDVVFLLTRMLPELCDRRHAHGHVEAAFDLYHERHPELMIDTNRVPRVDPD